MFILSIIDFKVFLLACAIILFTLAFIISSILRGTKLFTAKLVKTTLVLLSRTLVCFSLDISLFSTTISYVALAPGLERSTSNEILVPLIDI